MNEILRLTIRKNSTTNGIAFLLGLAITCGVVIIVNLFAHRSPAMFLNPYMMIFGIIFSGLAIMLHSAGKNDLIVYQHADKTVCIEVVSKKGEKLEINKPMKLEAFAAEDYMPRVGATSILYLKIYNATGDPALTLKLQLGKFNDVPLGFYPVKPSHVNPVNVYTCSKIAMLHQELIKWVHKD